MTTRRFITCLALWLLVLPFCVTCETRADEEDAALYLQLLESRLSSACNKDKVTRWNYVTNVTDENEAAAAAATREFTVLQEKVQSEILTNFSDWESLTDDRIRRQFHYLSLLGPASMPEEDVNAMNSIKAKLDSGYATTRICQYNSTNCNLTLADLDGMLSTVEDFDILQYYFLQWHISMSDNVNASDYSTYIQYQNIMAQHNGLSDISDLWLSGFNTGADGWISNDFKNLAKELWTQIQPYFNILHAFLRMKLRQNPLYTDKIEPAGSIPANLAQGWTLSKNDLLSIYSSTKPFPNATSIWEAGTDALVNSGYSVRRIFEDSDDFYSSLGLERMTDLFWENSMLEDPNDGRVVNCNPPFEWDMCLGENSKDFRIKLCGEVDLNYFGIIHHEMGHMQYFMSYKNLSFPFRDGANPGFHEAIGNAFPLSVTTPKHLECVLQLDLGLGTNCSSETGDEIPSQEDINYLYHLALEKLPFLAHTIALESWRWEVFEGRLVEAEYNERWWELKRLYQGLTLPTSMDTQFDAGTRVITTPNYIRYYISYILQFQLYEAMCQMSGNQQHLLHHCDFTGNALVGEKLKELLESGFSQPWPMVLSEFLGTDQISADSMISFFQPLFDHLLVVLEQAGERPCFDEYCDEI